MYNIYQEVNFVNGSKIVYPVSCPKSNSSRKGGRLHEKNYWNKVEYGIYTCSECNCRMTMRSEFKEEKIND